MARGRDCRPVFRLTVLLLPWLASPARADTGGFSVSRNWWGEWNADPVILLNLVLVAYLYHRGLARLWRVGVGRGVRVWRVAAFGAGMMALVGALVSPLDPMSDELSSAHMAQHMLLVNVAAPLLVLGCPFLVLLSGVPGPYRKALGRLWTRMDHAWLWKPVVVGLLYAAVLWMWHHPVAYQSALRDPVIHDLEHLLFLGVGVLFWRLVLDPLTRRRLHPLAAVAFLFITSLHTMTLGVFMALAPRPWYPAYDGLTEGWGLTLLEDQQLAGLIMWMPAGLVYVGVAVGRMIAWIEEVEG